MGRLGELLTTECIELDAGASTWQDAIRAAGDLLTRDRIAGSAYTQSMIENVENNGPYIVVAPGFAFAHARTSPAVYRTGMSWVRLDQPVSFGHKTNDPVSLVVALAATDAGEHRAAMADLAKLLADPAKRVALDNARTAADVLEAIGGDTSAGDHAVRPEPSRAKNLILTVCGNGLGTSLFLKNTLEQVLAGWGWGPFVTVEATDTISARGRSKEADLILTSGEIAKTLGEVGIPVRVVTDFTSTREVDSILRDSYEI
jgi:PTS system ascorbate-specific IIA component